MEERVALEGRVPRLEAQLPLKTKTQLLLLTMSWKESDNNAL